MDLLTLPGVFSPISDSWILARALAREGPGPGERVLDLCTGSGVLALTAARLGAEVDAVDVSRRATWTVRLNARRQGVSVRVHRGRLFEPIAGRRFDLVVSNPPYVPAPADDLPTRGPARAWAAGRDGRMVIDELCDRVGAHLRPEGVVLVTHSSLIGEDLTVERLRAAGLHHVTVHERHRGPLGPLMRDQQRLGTVPAHVTEEDVVIVRAVAAPADPGPGSHRP